MKSVEREQPAALLPPLPDENPPTQRKSPPWLQIFVIIGLVYGLGVSIFGAAINPTAENLTMVMAIVFSGIYTLLLYLSRKIWAPAVSSEKAVSNAKIFAIANALFISFMIKFCAQLIQSSINTESAVGSPNLLLSIPWLVGIILIFIPIQQKYNFSWAVLILLSGLYELIMEIWLNGFLVPLLSGQSMEIFYIVSDLVIFGYWQFAILYSSVFLVIRWIFEQNPVVEQGKKKPLRHALKPLIWIFPYSVYCSLIYFVFA